MMKRVVSSSRCTNGHRGEGLRPLARPLAAAVIALGLAPAAGAQSCPTAPCFLDLVTGQVTAACTSGPLSIASPPVDGSGNGYLETVLAADFDGLCKCLNVVLEFTTVPAGWDLNLCDSPGNNGYGGDGGQTDFEAELELVANEMRVYNAFFPLVDPPGLVDLLWRQDISIDQGAVKFRVCDQQVSWSPDAGTLDTTKVLKRLFYIPDPGASGPTDVFIGVNRVCSSTFGRNTGNVRRALITFD